MKALRRIANVTALTATVVPAALAAGGSNAVNLDVVSESSSSSSHHPPKGGVAVATGPDLINEMKALHSSLTNLQRLLETASVEGDTELMKRSAKFFRRARWLIYASQHEDSLEKTKQRKIEREMGGSNNKIRGGIGNGVVERPEDQERKLIKEQPELRDRVARNLYDATITFPECVEKFLEDCLVILNQELVALQLDAEIVTHEKRNIDQEGYNKVVIVTDLTGERVVGRGEGYAWYPFFWNDVLQGPHMIGVDGKFDCNGKTPEECCQYIKDTTPNPDTKGNYIDCHIFVPYGGVGNPKRTDRVLVNLSPDGRVQEAPYVS